MNLSYDYSDLIDEIQSDIQEGLLELLEPIKIVRSKKAVFDNYYPIVDYYYSDDECDEEFKEVLVKDVLIEMEQWNRIL